MTHELDEMAAKVRPHPISVPAFDVPCEESWGPHSRPNAPDGSIVLNRLDSFAGLTYLPTGEVVFIVDVPHTGVTVVQPRHGVVVVIPSQPEGTSPGHPDIPTGDGLRLIYTPDEACRTDPSIRADSFVVRVCDGRGEVTAITVPVGIARRATVSTTSDLPFLGAGSFSGRISAPLDDVVGCTLVSTALLGESIDSVVNGPGSNDQTSYGSVVVSADGSFIYSRNREWDFIPFDQIDDSFAIVAYTADNQWAAAVVPVGGGAMTTYPSMCDLLHDMTTWPTDR